MYFKKNNQRVAAGIFYFFVITFTLWITDPIPSFWIRMFTAIGIIVVSEGILSLCAKIYTNLKQS